jgi:hypothetical protein
LHETEREHDATTLTLRLVKLYCVDLQSFNRRRHDRRFVVDRREEDDDEEEGEHSICLPERVVVSTGDKIERGASGATGAGLRQILVNIGVVLYKFFFFHFPRCAYGAVPAHPLVSDLAGLLVNCLRDRRKGMFFT